MDHHNLPPSHGGPLGDVWFRGLAKPDHFLTALKEDFYILVAGCMMKYIRLERASTGLTYKARIVKAFNHGVDGVAAIAGNQFRDVYALAEKKRNPRIFLFAIHKTERGELEPRYMHSLRRIHSWDIRTLEFISKELLVVLTGFPTFNVVLFRWSTNEELMASQAIEPNLFSKLLVSPVNPCHWIEYGHEHMFVYEMPSLTRTDVIRTKINLPKRNVKFDHADPLMGKVSATRILSACWTIQDEFYVLDEQLGIHLYLPNSQVLQWTCSLRQTFLGMDVDQIVAFGDGLAALTGDGWFLSYSEIKSGGTLEVLTAYKLTSKVLRYIHFPENPDTFYAVTQSKGMVEGVSRGMLRDPFAIPDLMFTHILSCCFIEPQSDYMAIVTQFGKIVIMECDTGAPIAKWRLPFKVVGIGCHPVLPFLFCGTTYGCVNVLDIRNLKSPKLVNRRFFTREPNSSIDKFGFVSQGRYVISADTTNNRIFVQYGYPFMAFDFVDTTKVPAKISRISVPGCDKDDNRFQIYMCGKSLSDEGVVAFVINFSLRNDRLMVIASQIVDQPVTAMCLTPMRKYQYAYYPLRKGLALVPFCDDNQWLNLQEAEYFVETHQHLRHDVTCMVFNATKLYTFGEDGVIQVHDAPVIPKKKAQAIVLHTLARTHTHCFSDRGIKEGVVSLDGSQVIAIGQDGTFCRVRFFPKPNEPDWKSLGYERPKLLEYQVGTYLIDQEFQKAGEDNTDRIADIKVKLNLEDPINFYQNPNEETSDDDESVKPAAETPKVEATGEKLKYGPKKSFKGTVTRKKKGKKGKGSQDPTGDSGELGEQQDSSSESHPKRVTISELPTTEMPAGDATDMEDISSSYKETTQKSVAEESVLEPVPGNAADDERTTSFSPTSGTTAGPDDKNEKRDSKSTGRDSVGESTRKSVDQSVKTIADNSNSTPDPDPDTEVQPETQTVMEPVDFLGQAASLTEIVPIVPERRMSMDSTMSKAEPTATAPPVPATESSTVQKLMSKMQQAAPIAPTPLSLSDEDDKHKHKKGLLKHVTSTGTKTTAPSALKGLLSERMRRKEMVKEKEKGKVKLEAEKESKVEEAQEAEAKPEEQQEHAVEEVARAEETEDTGDDQEDAKDGKDGKPKKKKFADVTKAAKVLSMMYGKKGAKKGESNTDSSARFKKIKKFQGGQASKMLQVALKSADRVRAPPSRTARTKQGQAKMMKFLLEDDKADDKGKKRSKRSMRGKKGRPDVPSPPSPRKKEDDQSEASKVLMMETDTGKQIATVLHDPAIYLVPEQQAKDYDGLDVSEVLTVEHGIRRKEFTEAEFFAQFEKTLLYRQHIPKAQSLKEEFSHFTELMEELMFFNQQREEGNQVDMKEFNFDEDREPRLKERAEKIKKIAHIQMTVRNKLRHAKIKAMKYIVWDQFESKGMTLVGFRKKLEVSNYPLHPEREFFEGAVKEAISWRRLEMRFELEEEDALHSGDVHALRVLQHEMQFMSPAKKRLYMKSIMAIDPTVKFEDYEASDSDQSDQFFTKVFEELGLDLPDEEPKAPVVPKSKAGHLAKVAIETSKAASKFLSKLKKNNKGDPAAQPAVEEGYVEKLKRLLLEEAENEQLDLYKPVTVESSIDPSEDTTIVVQSRRDFMINIKPTKTYRHPTGLFGPRTDEYGNREQYTDDVEILMKPHMEQGGGDAAKGKNVSGAASVPDAQASDSGPLLPGGKPKLRMVIRQKKKMKFKRKPDVVFEEEEDLSGPEEEAVLQVNKKKFDMMDDAYKERFDTINNTFFGSSMSELTDMYQFQPAPFRYSQFDLGSRHELWRHHYIIMSEIYQLKKFFNRQFEMLRNSKGYSLKKMSDRNERIREIYYYLKVDLDILDEKWRIQEDPSQIFTVTKDEIPVEKYLTAEQRRLEELRRLEDLARRRTRMAEFRKKALIAMMDNRLEVKREEILVNDIPKPPFMLEKDPLEFTLEEYLLSLQYAEAVEALEKARVEMIKELEDELGRLYRANAMEINTIDLRVTELSLMKFQVYQNSQMEETRILRAIRQLRTMEELDKEEIRISKIVGELKGTMKTSQNMASQLANKKIVCEEEIAKVAEQERDVERNFRKDLGDVGQYFEVFYKNYKKKPKLSLKGLNKAEVYETMVRALRSDNIRVFARENGEIGRIVVMSIYDLEDPLLMPKDCPRSYWDKFNRVRRERLVCEYQTKTLMAEIDRINEAISECSNKEQEGTSAIAAVLGVISHKNDLKNFFVSNVEFQMVLGKGQCEINCWNYKDHMNSTVILIDNVEKLNQKIFEASEKLIKEMTRTATVHRDIKEIEWRFLVVEMATKDLKRVQHDVQCFKPTRKLLAILRQGINLDTMHEDRLALVDYLRHTYMKYQKIFLKTKKKQLGLYQHQTKRRHETNEEFKGNIFEETEALVANQVNKVMPDMGGKSKEETEKKAGQMLCKGYLNRKIIRLSNEIEKLEEELEKQYQKTYPVL